MKYSSSFIISAFRETWYSLQGYSSQLTDDQWEAPSDCPGWSVKDVLSHLVGTERHLLGESTPILDESEMPDHVKNDIGRLNEAWITELRDLSGAQVLAIFENVTIARLNFLEELSEEQFDEDADLPVGKGTYRDFMAMRVMDCFVHEQDIRKSTGGSFLPHDRSGRIAIEQLSSGLGYVIGKKLKPPEGAVIRVDVTQGEQVIASNRLQMQGSRAMYVKDGDVGVDDAALVCSFEAFVFATAGRIGAQAYLLDGSVRFEGDVDLGLALYTNFGFLI